MQAGKTEEATADLGRPACPGEAAPTFLPPRAPSRPLSGIRTVRGPRRGGVGGGVGTASASGTESIRKQWGKGRAWVTDSPASLEIDSRPAINSCVTAGQLLHLSDLSVLVCKVTVLSASLGCGRNSRK